MSRKTMSVYYRISYSNSRSLHVKHVFPLNVKYICLTLSGTQSHYFLIIIRLAGDYKAKTEKVTCNHNTYMYSLV